MAPGTKGFVPVLHAATRSRPDEIDTLNAAEAVAHALEASGYAAEIVSLSPGLGEVDALPARRPRTVFNLVDAIDGDGRLAPMVPARLDALGLPYTGAGTGAWIETLSKVTTKLKLAHAGLPTPEWSEDGTDLAPGVRVIVKPVWEHGSLGLDTSSVMTGKAASQAITSRNARWRTEHFAEVFVEGREFNVSLLEDAEGVRVLPMAEIVFEAFDDGNPRIVGYDAKWTTESAAYIGTPRRFGVEHSDPGLAERLKQYAVRCWELFGVRGYARVDFRIDAAGNPFVLEVNMNPCLTPDAGFAAAALEGGITYQDMIASIVEVPLARLQATA